MATLVRAHRKATVTQYNNQCGEQRSISGHRSQNISKFEAGGLQQQKTTSCFTVVTQHRYLKMSWAPVHDTEQPKIRTSPSLFPTFNKPHDWLIIIKYISIQ